MSEYKEQHPLLHDSDVESDFACSHKHRRARYPVCGEKSRAQIKGAAFIIKRWPDYISSLLAYWWAGFGMIAVIIFLIYNSVSLIDMATPVRLPVAINEAGIEDLQSIADTSKLDIFTHIFVQSYEEMNNDIYLKHIKTLAKKFTHYKYNFIVVLNDISTSMEKNKNIIPKMNNDMAMSSVLTTDKVFHNENWNDISIQYISLSNYLDNSPVKEYWRNLPFHVLEFLTRCVAIWNKGGIAFNPIIITAQSPNQLYMEKLQNTIKKYKKSGNITKLRNKYLNQRGRKKIPRVNNIRDIINILENNSNDVGNIPQYNLSEADNIQDPYVIKTININEDNNGSRFERELRNNNNSIHNIKDKNEEEIHINVSGNYSKSFVTKEDTITETATKQSLWKLIFRNESKTNEIVNNRLGDHQYFGNEAEFHKSFNNITPDQHSVVKYNSDRTTNTLDTNTDLKLGNTNYEYIPELTIDVNGNIIATKTPCHAFIGTIFSNVKHYSSNKSIRDMIIDELSIFCKGMQSSCKYIDLILL